MTQQLWLVRPLFTGIFFTLGIVMFFQLIVRSALRCLNQQRQKIDWIDFSVGWLRFISVLYFSALAIFFEYSGAHVHHYVAFINFRLLLLVFVVVFLGLRSSLIIMLCDDLSHLFFYHFTIVTLYHSIFVFIVLLIVYLGVSLIQRNNSAAAWIIPATTGVAIIVWVTIHLVDIQGIGLVTRYEMMYNIISFLIMETLLFYGLTSLFQENQQLLTITRQASIDDLTKVKNYNVFNKEYAQVFADARQKNLTLTMLEMDIDRFKNINDQYGHLAGNEVLRQVGATLKRVTKQVAQAECYRTGGEEFNVLLPDLAVTTAAQFANRLQAELAQLDVIYNHEHIQVTVSVGIATLRAHDQSADHLFERADRMLYLSKGRGRNLVTTDETA
ncbi:GGDEF domain-containing protein [Loigolactobacillus jiayinensis]|uniref:GGDEF domain-containing protein n=1 Tax=Loigolactobacillus jiayinensis TaxID=2486016 RepID=A0ABW1RJU2_9LACO|nr:GGDEF domain-containing protein [Loigolactobacillus jiayinensis]